MDYQEMRGLLGDAYDETSEARREALSKAAATIDAFYAGRDDEPGRTEAIAGALAVILGDDWIEDAGARYLAARAAEQSALASLRGAAAAAAAMGVPDKHIAERAGVSRDTVLKALGKRGTRKQETA